MWKRTKTFFNRRPFNLRRIKIKKKLTNEEVVQRCKDVHGDKFDYSLVSFTRAESKITIICNTCNFKFEIILYNFLRIKRCRRCANVHIKKLKTKSLESFLIKQKQVHGDLYTYISGYEHRRSRVLIKCNKCNTIFEQIARSHIDNKYGCAKCAYKQKSIDKTYPIDKFEEECKIIHNNRYDYFQDYTGCRQKIKIKCKKCLRLFYQQAALHKLQECGCPHCKMSHGELTILNWLEKNKIKFKTQKTFPDCKNIARLKFDFYLPSYNTCIEYDGEQHYYAFDSFGGQQRLDLIRKRDEIKNDYCIKNNIKLIRIPYTEYKNIESILDEEFFEIKRNKNEKYISVPYKRYR